MDDYGDYKEAAKIWLSSPYKCRCSAILHVVPDSEYEGMAGFDLVCAACGDLYDLKEIRKRASDTLRQHSGAAKSL